MVALVFISNSRLLAKTVCDFIKSVTKVSIPIDFSGGLGDSKEELGTDVTDIIEAIERVYSDDGVILFTDLQNSLLSAHTAISMLDYNKRKNVRISSAPFIEGGVTAAVHASLSKDIDSVCKEISVLLKPHEEEYMAKKSVENCIMQSNYLKDLLEDDVVIEASSSSNDNSDFSLAETILKDSILLKSKTKKNIDSVVLDTIDNSKVKSYGLKDSFFDMPSIFSKYSFNRIGTGIINKKNILPYAKDIKYNFDDVTVIHGGRVRAKAKYIKTNYNIEKESIKDVKKEKTRLISAIKKAEKNILHQKNSIKNKKLNGKEEGIFEAYITMLLDIETIENTLHLIEKERVKASYAYFTVMSRIYDNFSVMKDNPYMEARKYDINDILYHVLDNLLGEEAKDIADENVILILDSVYPSHVANISENVLGFISLYGSRFSHSSILLKSLKIISLIWPKAYILDGKIVTIDTEDKRIISY